MQSRNYLMGILIAILVVVDAGLIAYAMRPGPTVNEVVNPTVSSSASAEPEPDASDAGSASESSAAGADAADAVPLTQFIVATTEKSAWAAEAGTCDKPGKVSVTRAQGVEWKEQEAPGSITRLRVLASNTAFIGGGDADCKLTRWNTGDSGAKWKEVPVSDFWAREPKSTDTVHTPADQVQQVCGPDNTVVDLSPVTNDVAFVLCDGGRVLLTQDKGETWTKAVTNPGAVAVSAYDENSGVLAAITGECRGVTLLPFDKGKIDTKTGCAKVAPKVPGKVAVSALDSGVWLIADGQVFRADEVDGTYKQLKSPFK